MLEGRFALLGCFPVSFLSFPNITIAFQNILQEKDIYCNLMKIQN